MRFLAVVNLALSPFIALFMMMYFLLHHVEKFYHDPGKRRPQTVVHPRDVAPPRVQRARAFHRTAPRGGAQTRDAIRRAISIAGGFDGRQTRVVSRRRVDGVCVGVYAPRRRSTAPRRSVRSRPAVAHGGDGCRFGGVSSRDGGRGESCVRTQPMDARGCRAHAPTPGGGATRRTSRRCRRSSRGCSNSKPLCSCRRCSPSSRCRSCCGTRCADPRRTSCNSCVPSRRTGEASGTYAR